MDSKLELREELEKACKEAVKNLSWEYHPEIKEEVEKELSEYVQRYFKPKVTCEMDGAVMTVTVEVPKYPI